jgi:hypothetical protein
MSDDTTNDVDKTVNPDAPAEEPEKSLWARIPSRIFRGRVRTTTAALVLLFIAALFLYGQRSDHYANLDEDARQAQISQQQRVPQTTTPAPVEEAPVETSTPTSTTTPSTTAPPTLEESTSSSSEPPATTTTQQPQNGLRLPPLPTISIAP